MDVAAAVPETDLRVREALPDRRLVEFDGVSHIGPVRAPDRVSAEVRSFHPEGEFEPAETTPRASVGGAVRLSVTVPAGSRNVF